MFTTVDKFIVNNWLFTIQVLKMTGESAGQRRTARQQMVLKIRLAQSLDRCDAVVEGRMGGKKTAATAAARGAANPGERIEHGVFTVAGAA